jgi:divalent metal cation (Fe/Co/Zn/Cd) transporter
MYQHQPSNEAMVWQRQFLFLCLLTAFVNLLQCLSGILLWIQAASPLLLVFGLDAMVGGAREAILARRIARSGTSDVDAGKDRMPLAIVAGGYILVGLTALLVGGAFLIGGREPRGSFLGVGLAAISMLLIPIIGSYMKSLAMEARSPALKAASVFTFGNSYLSMVLLIGLLINAGTRHWWGDPLGAIVMSPFIVQKGIQMLVESRDMEFVED